ncbi:hypothetical protein V7968_03915 [Nocardia vulneris]|uniref:hypothetical protein n=1 Tax=Nocardia vulneris TaxID=1141657 RepID=UPI0030D56882
MWWRSAVVAGAAVLAVVVATLVGGRSGDDATDIGTTTTTRSRDTTPVSAVWNIPQAFLGNWRGIAEDGQRVFDLEVTIKPGKNSEELVLVTQTERISGNRCETIDRVITVDETELTLAARPVGGTDCAAVEGASVVRLQPDGSLAYAGSVRTATLYRG